MFCIVSVQFWFCVIWPHLSLSRDGALGPFVGLSPSPHIMSSVVLSVLRFSLMLFAMLYIDFDIEINLN